MIAVIIVSIILSVIYYLLLKKYAELWDDLPDTQGHFEPAVDLIIAFRNEQERLPALLDALQSLNYPEAKLNCIFINDHSSDNGKNIIQNYPLKFAKSVIDLNHGEGKKAAIREAWHHSKAQILAHTDADCIFDESWLRTLLKPFENERIQFVSGPVDYHQRSGFFHGLLRHDFFALVGIGAAHIAWSRPMICNGANLAYRSSVIGQLDLKDDMASGDDVFLMQSVHNAHPQSVAFVKSVEAIVYTHGPEDFRTFIHQRLRWAGKNTDYSDQRNTRLLILSWLFNLVLLANLLSMQRILWLTAGLMLVLKLLAELQFYERLSRFFVSKNWVKYSVYGQLFHVPYMALLPILSKLIKYQWKDRKLK